jgi:hypothetical protein
MSQENFEFSRRFWEKFVSQGIEAVLDDFTRHHLETSPSNATPLVRPLVHEASQGRPPSLCASQAGAGRGQQLPRADSQRSIVESKASGGQDSHLGGSG